jgi:hypothetical protein
MGNRVAVSRAEPKAQPAFTILIVTLREQKMRQLHENTHGRLILIVTKSRSEFTPTVLSGPTNSPAIFHFLFSILRLCGTKCSSWIGMLLATRHSPVATEFLIATVSNSRIALTHSKHRTSHFPNRNT